MHYSMLLLALDFQPSGNGSVPADRSLDVIIDKGMEGENHIVILCVILMFTFFFFFQHFTGYSMIRHRGTSLVKMGHSSTRSH